MKNSHAYLRRQPTQGIISLTISNRRLQLTWNASFNSSWVNMLNFFKNISFSFPWIFGSSHMKSTSIKSSTIWKVNCIRRESASGWGTNENLHSWMLFLSKESIDEKKNFCSLLLNNGRGSYQSLENFLINLTVNFSSITRGSCRFSSSSLPFFMTFINLAILWENWLTTWPKWGISNPFTKTTYSNDYD